MSKILAYSVCVSRIEKISKINSIEACQFVIKKSLKLNPVDVRCFPSAARLTPA